MTQLIRKYTLLIVTTTMMLIGTSSCRKAYINGDFDGMWRVWQVENIKTGTGIHHVNTQRYFCFNLHTAHLQDSNSGIIATGNFKFDGSKLKLDFPTIHNSSILEPWGIDRTSVTFTVVISTSEIMTLSNDTYKIQLRKF